MAPPPPKHDDDSYEQFLSFITKESIDTTPCFNRDDNEARNLDVPVSNVINKCEKEAMTYGNENKGFLSFRNGFLPMVSRRRSVERSVSVSSKLVSHLTYNF